MPYHINTINECVCTHYPPRKGQFQSNFFPGTKYKYRLEYNQTKFCYVYRVYYKENCFMKYNLTEFTVNFSTII